MIDGNTTQTRLGDPAQPQEGGGKPLLVLIGFGALLWIFGPWRR